MSQDSDFESCVTPTNLITSNGTNTFEANAGKTWIYPINFPVRDYQFNIIQKALFHNTLVSLPTGLGKTFIAAVVMYNFYRWYPSGKILFLAPTRPLVKQQMDACCNITAIPRNATAEMTGGKGRNMRQTLWKTKRVFFMTPQVLRNDLDIITGQGADIRCIVFDEAHKAKGNYAYAIVIKEVLKFNDSFRVLALSATPGKDVHDIVAVIQNLLISHLEFRNENSIDVQPYIFERIIETIVVPLDSKILSVKKSYLNIIETYTRTLIKYKVIQGNCNTLTKGKILMTLKDFQAKHSGNHNPNYSEILRNLNVCVTLYHAYELLICQGLRSFVYFFEEHLHKPLLHRNTALRQIVENVKEYFESRESSQVANPTIENIKFGHPKFLKLREIVTNHFTENGSETRIIVFFEYRESVKEAYTLLLKEEPIIRSRIFIGQTSGMTQRDQLSALQAFKEGKCNTLLSTSVGEEGIDVGEVDLIICFDISSRSPIRMIQRIGRTGRKRKGRIVALVTEGKEQQTLAECLQQKKYLTNDVTILPVVTNALYKHCPRMIPDDVIPRCEKMYFAIESKTVQKKNSVFTMLDSKFNPCVESVEEVDTKTVKKMPQAESFWDKSKPLASGTILKCYKNIDAIRKPQPHSEIHHSISTHALTSLLQMADYKRFNIPSIYQSQRKNLVQEDIRNIFKQPETGHPNSSQEQTSSTKTVQNKFETFSDEVCSEIAHFLGVQTTLQSSKDFKSSLSNYESIPNLSSSIMLDTWMKPNLSVLHTLNKEDFMKLVSKRDNSNKGDYGIDGRSDVEYSFNNHVSIDESRNQERNYQEYTKMNILSDDKKKPVNRPVEYNIVELLSFFNLDSLEDVFIIPKSSSNTKII